ncbi:MAG: ABC transporter permease [Anaerolineales bacterium]
MISDIITIIWKEIRELILQRSGLRGGGIGLLIVLVVFGVLIPLQSGPDWLTSSTTILLWAWVPFILVNSVVADSFAGERERHTLETLLASRLSDRAILIGKICSAIAYGWGITLFGILVALVVINVAFNSGNLLFFPLPNGLAIFIFSFLVAWLAAGLGVLVSLRASSVRQAQQTLSLAFLVFLIPLLLLPLLPQNMQINVSNALQAFDFQSAALIAGAALLVIDLVLLGMANLRFKRARLILDQS